MSSSDYIRLGFKVPFITDKVFTFIYDQNATFFPIVRMFSKAHNQTLTQAKLLVKNESLEINSTPKQAQVIDKDIITLQLDPLSEKSPSWTLTKAIEKAIGKVEDSNQSITVFILAENSNVFVALNFKKSDNLGEVKDRFQKATGRKVTDLSYVGGHSLGSGTNDETTLKTLGAYNGATFEIRHDGGPLIWEEALDTEQTPNVSNQEKESSAINMNFDSAEDIPSSSYSRVFGSVSITSLIGHEDGEDRDTIMGNTEDNITQKSTIENDTTAKANGSIVNNNNGGLTSIENQPQKEPSGQDDGTNVTAADESSSNNGKSNQISNGSEIEGHESVTPSDSNPSSRSQDAIVNDTTTSMMDDTTEFPAPNQQSIGKDTDSGSTKLTTKTQAQTFLDNSQAWSQQNEDQDDTGSNSQASLENNIGTQIPQPTEVSQYKFKIKDIVCSLNENDTFQSILEPLQNKAHDIEMTFRYLDRVIELTDTPTSIGAAVDKVNEIEVLVAEPELVTFVLADTDKLFRSVYLKAKMKIKLKKVFEIYASKNQLNWKELTFKLNGRILKRQDTPSIAGLRNGSKVDVILPSKKA